MFPALLVVSFASRIPLTTPTIVGIGREGPSFIPTASPFG
jgi:hypothetical protein